MIIPYRKLSPEALRGVIEEAVTRDGTELTDAEPKIQEVMGKLAAGTVVITYDPETRTCNIVAAESVRDDDGDSG